MRVILTRQNGINSKIVTKSHSAVTVRRWRLRIQISDSTLRCERWEKKSTTVEIINNTVYYIFHTARLLTKTMHIRVDSHRARLNVTGATEIFNFSKKIWIWLSSFAVLQPKEYRIRLIIHKTSTKKQLHILNVFPVLPILSLCHRAPFCPLFLLFVMHASKWDKLCRCKSEICTEGAAHNKKNG